MKMRLSSVLGALILGATACGAVTSEEAIPIEVQGTVQSQPVQPVGVSHSDTPARVAFATAPGRACYQVSNSVYTPVTSTQSFDVAGFDSSRGTLTSVKVITQVDAAIVGTVTNSAANEFPFVIYTLPATTGSITGPGGVSANVTPFEQVYSQTIGPNSTVELDASPVVGTQTQEIADLSLYQGSSVTFSTVGSGAFGTSVSGDVEVVLRVVYLMTATVEYCYTTAGSVGVTKTVTVDAGVDPGTFDFEISCTSGFNRIVHIAGAGSLDVEGMEAGDTCTVTEVFPGPSPGVGWSRWPESARRLRRPGSSPVTPPSSTIDYGRDPTTTVRRLSRFAGARSRSAKLQRGLTPLQLGD